MISRSKKGVSRLRCLAWGCLPWAMMIGCADCEPASSSATDNEAKGGETEKRSQGNEPGWISLRMLVGEAKNLHAQAAFRTKPSSWSEAHVEELAKVIHQMNETCGEALRETAPGKGHHVRIIKGADKAETDARFVSQCFAGQLEQLRKAQSASVEAIEAYLELNVAEGANTGANQADEGERDRPQQP